MGKTGNRGIYNMVLCRFAMEQGEHLTFLGVLRSAKNVEVLGLCSR